MAPFYLDMSEREIDRLVELGTLKEVEHGE